MVSHHIGSVATSYSGIKEGDGGCFPENVNGHEVESHAPPHRLLASYLTPFHLKNTSSAPDQINRYRWIQIPFDRAVVDDMLEHPALCLRDVSWQADHNF